MEAIITWKTAPDAGKNLFNATSGWVLLVGVLWIVLMTYICYIGIELSAATQRCWMNSNCRSRSALQAMKKIPLRISPLLSSR